MTLDLKKILGEMADLDTASTKLLNIIDFFLKRNLEKIFGKNIEIDEITRIYSKNSEDAKQWGIGILGELYIISFQKGEITFKNNNNPLCFKITYNQDKIANLTVYSKDDQIITDYEDMSMTNEKSYNYKKSVVEADGHTTEYPLYRLKAVGAKIRGKECYELNCLDAGENNQSVFQKLVNNFKKNNLYYLNISENMEPAEQLSYVYEILEKETEKEQTFRR